MNGSDIDAYDVWNDGSDITYGNGGLMQYYTNAIITKPISPYELKRYDYVPSNKQTFNKDNIMSHNITEAFAIDLADPYWTNWLLFIIAAALLALVIIEMSANSIRREKLQLKHKLSEQLSSK